MINRKELQHIRDLIAKIEARLSHQRRMTTPNAGDERRQQLNHQLIFALERRLLHLQVQHKMLLAEYERSLQHANPAIATAMRKAGGTRHPRP